MLYKNLLLITFFLLLFTSCEQKDKSKLTIATAANMQFAMHELTKEFTKETGVICESITSSSGKLTAQIKEGAPYDVFVSADIKFPNELFQTGFTMKKPKIYAYGKLVIWTMNSQLNPDFESLTKKHINHIAVANPKTAPYGIAAEEVLKKKNLYDKIQKKLVFGESVAQTNQFIVSYAAEIGFTAKSVVLSQNQKGKGNWKEVNENLYTPIAQGVVVLKNRNIHIEDAHRFQDFLFSVKGKEILNKFGYSVSK
ncbi:MAG: molybdate ABC transporter substrate-binding protein [Flavobacteriaceae bacterium]|nr:molybdate ABC transporter substrate-binding protein [Flavobacteriaceae bacterium]